MARIYLLGGMANTGKSTCARLLAQRFRLDYCEVDGLRLRLQRSVGGDDPIQYFGDCSWLEQEPEVSLLHKIEVADRTCHGAVAPFLTQCRATGCSVIVDGDDLLPDFTDEQLSAGVAGAAFLFENDSDLIRQRYLARDQTGCIRGDRQRLEQFIQHYLGWAEWWRDRALALGFPVVDARGGVITNDVAVALGLQAVG